MNTNALSEFLTKVMSNVPDGVDIVGLKIYWKNEDGSGWIGRIEDIHRLNFTYDSGWGIQELFGVVWLSDGTWFARGEYDGSEWWEHIKPPTPEDLQQHCEYVLKDH